MDTPTDLYQCCAFLTIPLVTAIKVVAKERAPSLSIWNLGISTLLSSSSLKRITVKKNKEHVIFSTHCGYPIYS